MSNPIEDYSSKPPAGKPKESGQPQAHPPGSGNDFASIHNKPTPEATHGTNTQAAAKGESGASGSKGSHQSFKDFLGPEKYKAWLQAFNSSIVHNIAAAKKKQEKVEREMKAAATGGNMWDV